MTTRLLAGTLIGLTLSTGAFAQSFTAPAGIPAVTAPGGVEGRAALPNLARSGNVDGVIVDGDGTVLTTGSVNRAYRHHGTVYGR